jgi:hypothetical protein
MSSPAPESAVPDTPGTRDRRTLAPGRRGTVACHRFGPCRWSDRDFRLVAWQGRALINHFGDPLVEISGG